jgi:uncharacterized membrane protein YqjE
MQELTTHRAGMQLVDHDEDDSSVGDLMSRLAHESKELVALEVRRLRVEVRDQARRAAKTAAAGYGAIELVALATLALAVAVFLVLADVWDSYAAAAFATSGLLAVAALVLGLTVRGMTKKMFGAFDDEVRDLARDGRAIRGD